MVESIIEEKQIPWFCRYVDTGVLAVGPDYTAPRPAESEQTRQTPRTISLPVSRRCMECIKLRAVPGQRLTAVGEGWYIFTLLDVMLPPYAPAWNDRFQLRLQASPQEPPQLLAFHARRQYVPVVRLQVHAWNAHVRHDAEDEGANAPPKHLYACCAFMRLQDVTLKTRSLRSHLVECVLNVKQVAILPDGIAQRWRQAFGH